MASDPFGEENLGLTQHYAAACQDFVQWLPQFVIDNSFPFVV